MALPRFTLDKTALLVADVQDKLLPLIHDAQRVERQCVKLIRGCAALGLPILVTEQYPRGLGGTTAGVRAVLPRSTRIEPKMKFSGCVEGVRQALCQHETRAVL